MSRAHDGDRDLLAPLSEAARRRASEDAGDGPRPETWRRVRFARERDRARGAGPRRWTLPVVAAAGLVLALGGWLARRPRPLTYVVTGGEVEANGYVACAGEAPTELRFSDGTRVRLERGTRMSVAAPGPRGARLRVEDGQAHFEVIHRPGADWSVEAGPYRVQVTGTVFDVRWSAGDEAVIALRVGSVRVTGPHLAAPVTLAPGQRLVARLASADVRLEAGPLDEVASAPPAPVALALAAPPVANPSASITAAPSNPAPAAEREPPPTAPQGEALTRPRAAPRASGRAASGPRETLAPDGWARRVANGESAAVLSEARAHVFDDVIGDVNVDARSLAALADAARYDGQPALSQRALTELRRRFPDSAEARTAAFQLGRMADDAGDARGALAWYRRYADEAPRGPYAAEAFGRELLDIERLSGRAAAAPAARAYLARFPDGTYLLQARAMLGLP